MSNISIHIHDKSYLNASDNSTKKIINNVSLFLKNNEFVCLVGHSGCGKTSLLNILAGLDSDFSGDINLGNTQPKVGYIFQSPRLLPWRTVEKNISLATDCSSEDLDFLLANMGLSEEKQHFPAQLSLGMSRRVSIARAFANNPDLLLMDEPFVSLDSPTARQVRQLLVNLWQKRPHNVLFVTHDLREAITLADRLIFLDSKPMTIMKEVRVNIPREDRNNETKIEQFRQQLFIDYPEIHTLL